MSNTKKKVVILGYSSIVKRRVLPALKKIKKLRFEICSTSSSRQYIGESKWYRDYREALDSSDSEIVYISLPNSKHFKWARKALLGGFHVIIDKPATTNLKETLKLIKIAKMKKKILAEALVYDYHKQISKALKLTGKTKSLKGIHANFCIPAPSKNNIRSIPEMAEYAAHNKLKASFKLAHGEGGKYLCTEEDLDWLQDVVLNDEKLLNDLLNPENMIKPK